MSRIVFVPVCEECGYEFNYLNLEPNFNMICPKCGNHINSISFPSYKYLMKTDFNSMCVQFCYGKKELYGA